MSANRKRKPRAASTYRGARRNAIKDRRAAELLERRKRAGHA